MKVFFDTSVLVSAVIEQLPRHPAAHAAFVHHTNGENTACCSTHALAEAYATLTALPLARRISSDAALRLIETNFIPRLTVLPLDAADYAHSLRRVSALGLSSGIIYDALHLRAAETAGCERLLTYNLAHFTRLQSQHVLITIP
ncbi:MAG: PIN domain-containing protein [Burkholderiales bacterium]|nr:PIN domain-containing protein [Opitutaceae bacterium]